MREVKVLEVFIVLDVVMYSSVRLFAVYSMRVKLFCIDSCRVCPETCLITMHASVSTRNNRESAIYLVNCKVRSDCDRLLDCSCVENRRRRVDIASTTDTDPRNEGDGERHRKPRVE
jgi:hypothetical protein